MLVTSIFSFSNNVSKALCFRVVKSRDCVVKELKGSVMFFFFSSSKPNDVFDV